MTTKTLPRPFGSYLLTAALPDDALGRQFRALRTAADGGFARLRVLDAAELSSDALLDAIDANGEVHGFLKNPAVARGVDLFDCVLPTRNARNGQLFTRQGPLNIKNARFAEDDAPPDPSCGCYTCAHFSRAYLRHLYISGEITGSILNTVHNVTFYLDTMRLIRHAITFGTFSAFKQEYMAALTVRPFAS